MSRDDAGEGPVSFSRRDFLKGAGAAAIATSALQAGPGASPALAQPVRDQGFEVRGPQAVSIELKVNGNVHKVAVEPRATLLDTLRNQLDVTGPKKICDRGACSGCVVLLNEQPVCSCLTLAIDCEGAAITTVEGLAHGDELHPVQAAFVEHDALQCGFCTPGMVMSVTALLKRKPDATLDDVKHAVAGNICRCGTYPKVFEAALAAGKKMQGR
ncbi:MAG: (2Fe-2S)-binding protein [Planctomycetota bacterium]